MEHTKHLWRAALLVVFGLISYALGVGFLKPATFGLYGHYRATDLLDQMNVYTPEYGEGADSCAICHEERVREILATPHGAVNCETCHAPLRTHVEYDRVEAFLESPEQFDKTADMLIRDTDDLCIRCHASQPAIPDDFPQVIVQDHLNERDMELVHNVCLECHDPHSPEA
jgi:hypothetical protein